MNIDTKSVEGFLQSYDSDGDGWYHWYYMNKGDEREVVSGIKKVTIIDSESAGEGDYHADIYIVFKVDFTDGTSKYYRKDGTYASYDGTSWDGRFAEVRLVTKTVEVYE